jgi:hypothetical protein
MTEGRWALLYNNLDVIMTDVERLLKGHTTVGNWSLARICRHLSTVMRRVVDLPASTPHDPSRWVGGDRKCEVPESGMLPEGLPGPPEIMPLDALGNREEADGLRAAIAHYRASPGPVIPHRIVGPLTKAEWDRLQFIHVAHHLSFAVSKAIDEGR